MAKYRNPFNSQELWISQTYHSTSSNKAVDFGNAPAGTPVYAIADGTIGTISSAYGSYLTLDVANSDHKLFYVHIYNFKVNRGQSVKRGQLLAEIAPQSVNGGYPPHLHLGLQTQYNLMDYMDRSIAFRTRYQAIKDMWFIGENLNWSLFEDLSYLNNAMSFKKGDRVQFTGTQWIRKGAGDKFDQQRSTIVNETATIIDGPRTSQNKQFGKGANDNYTWWDLKYDKGGSGWVADVNKFKPVKPPTPPELPTQTECEKQVDRLKDKIKGLEAKLGTQEGELDRRLELIEDLEDERGELQELYDIAKEQRDRFELERNEIVRQFNEYRLNSESSFIEKIKEFVGEVLAKILGDRF